MKISKLLDKFYETSVGRWVVHNPIKAGLILAFISLFHSMGLKYLFTSPFNYQAEIKELGLSLYLPIPDFVGCLLGGLTVGYGYQLMKGINHYYKKTKKVFILGLISLALTFTNGSDYLTLVMIGMKQTAYVGFYQLTGQEDKLNKLIACLNGKEEFVLGDEDYSFVGKFHKEFTEAKITKLYVSGTITNDTNETWDMVTVAIGIVDENGNPKKVPSYDEFPILYATVNKVDPNETVTFKTNDYPGVLEKDYEGLVDYQLLGVKTTRFIED